MTLLTGLPRIRTNNLKGLGAKLTIDLVDAATGEVHADLVTGLIVLNGEPWTTPDAISTLALIDHIEARFHAVHRRELPELVR